MHEENYIQGPGLHLIKKPGIQAETVKGLTSKFQVTIHLKGL